MGIFLGRAIWPCRRVSPGLPQCLGNKIIAERNGNTSGIHARTKWLRPCHYLWQLELSIGSHRHVLRDLLWSGDCHLGLAGKFYIASGLLIEAEQLYVYL
jgi:hypothetical protein